jgi:cytoskeletal protein CcmA (bactofilin family)
MRKLLTSLTLFIVAFFVLSVSQVSAKVVNDKGDYNLPKGEVLNDDLIVGAQTVEIDGTVNGDVFVGAQTVKVTGVINGTLHVGANTIDLGGEITGNVYAGAQSILVNSAKIDGSLFVGSATLTADKESSIGGSLFAGAGAVSLDSSIGRNAYLGAGTLTIGGDTVIGKDLYYGADQNKGQVSISEDATITGNTYKSEVKAPQKDVQMATNGFPVIARALKLSSSIISLIGALIVGFLFLKLFGKKKFTEIAGMVTNSFWKTMGVGFLVTIAIVPGIVILLITVVGIPVAALAFLLILIYIYLAKIVVGSAFGTWITQRVNWKTSVYGAFALGLVAIYILRLIPFVGFIAGLVVLWCGLGAFTLKLLSKAE